MSNRRIHLKEISELLKPWNGNRQILIGAAHQYWAASLDADEWPEAFAKWHERICCLILSRGNIRSTIEAMDDSTARLTAGELLRFSESASSALTDDFIPPFAGSGFLPPSLPAQWRAEPGRVSAHADAPA